MKPDQLPTQEDEKNAIDTWKENFVENYGPKLNRNRQYEKRKHTDLENLYKKTKHCEVSQGEITGMDWSCVAIWCNS